jgi:hypothetical protein
MNPQSEAGGSWFSAPRPATAPRPKQASKECTTAQSGPCRLLLCFCF